MNMNIYASDEIELEEIATVLLQAFIAMKKTGFYTDSCFEVGSSEFENFKNLFLITAFPGIEEKPEWLDEDKLNAIAEPVYMRMTGARELNKGVRNRG